MKSRDGRMVYRSLPPMQMQTQPQSLIPGQVISPDSGQQWRTMMRKGSPSGLDLLKGPPWSLMPPEVMLLSVVHAAVPDPDGAWDPCDQVPSMLPPVWCLGDVLRFFCLRMPSWCECMCSHLSPCWDPWPLQLVKAINGLVVLTQSRAVLMSVASVTAEALFHRTFKEEVLPNSSSHSIK